MQGCRERHLALVSGSLWGEAEAKPLSTKHALGKVHASPISISEGTGNGNGSCNMALPPTGRRQGCHTRYIRHMKDAPRDP